MKKSLMLLISVSLMNSSLYADSICSVIDAPGVYSYGAGVIANPTDPDDAIICITTSDVTVNLAGGVFKQDSLNTVTGLTGIRVAPNLSNIVIHNGTVQGVSGIGIVIGAGCTNVSIENITIIDCDATGILFNGTISEVIKDVEIKNCTIYSCTGLTGDPAYGLRLVYCDNVLVNNGTFNKNDAGTAGVGYGISAEWCTSCNFKNCDANANGGSTLGVGINIYNSDWTIIEKCITINNISRSGSTSQAVGILLDTSDHTTILGCISKHNNNALAEGYGFKSIDGNDNLFENCIAKQNVGGSIAAGFLLTGNEANSSILKSQSRINNGGASGDGYGILLDGSQDCDILFNDVIGNTGLTGVGIKDTTVDTSNLIAGNVAFVNITAGYDVTRTVGAFPVVTASLGDFTNTTTSKYMNVDFIQ